MLCSSLISYILGTSASALGVVCQKLKNFEFEVLKGMIINTLCEECVQ